MTPTDAPSTPALSRCALGVGLSFGLLFVSLDRSGDDFASGRCCSPASALPILVLVALVQFRRNRPEFGRQLVMPAAAVGVLIAGSARDLPDLDARLLSIVAVVVAMYPASTILLAALIDGEARHARTVGWHGARRRCARDDHNGELARRIASATSAAPASPNSTE